MAERTRKPPIKPELRRQWLRRSEEEGESPPQIAEKDHYDIRTVRKQLELAREEREAREARAKHLLNALEKHHADLRGYADRLNSEIMGYRNVPVTPDDDFIASALRQHIPRSPVWALLSKRKDLLEREAGERQKLQTAIGRLVADDEKLKPLAEARMDEVVPGVTSALVKSAEQWSQGSKEYSLKDSLVMHRAGEGRLIPHFGFAGMGEMEAPSAESNAIIIRGALIDLESRVRDSREYLDLEKSLAEIARLAGKLREELAVIRLKGIVPGRCRFCPL